MVTLLLSTTTVTKMTSMWKKCFLLWIQRLIQHIPEKYYKMIRYGGLYARHQENDQKLHRAISHEKHHIYRSFHQWRTAILSAFGYDPLKCECGTTMLFLELYFNHKRVSLEEMYEKVMFHPSKIRISYKENKLPMSMSLPLLKQKSITRFFTMQCPLQKPVLF